jgi:hypothetical protein
MASRILRLPAVIQLTGLCGSPKDRFLNKCLLARERSGGAKSTSRTGSNISNERHDGLPIPLRHDPNLAGRLVFFACSTAEGCVSG